MAAVELKARTKRYGETAAVADVSLRVEHGQLVCLLGPSGCGKTTTLRLIAGFIEPSAGEIVVGGKVLSSPQRTVPPEGRNMSMIFQSYALWPHMTVAENVSYGLRIRKLDKATIDPKLKDKAKRALVPVVRERLSLVAQLQSILRDLGLDRKVPEVTDLATYLARSSRAP